MFEVEINIKFWKLPEPCVYCVIIYWTKLVYSFIYLLIFFFFFVGEYRNHIYLSINSKQLEFDRISSSSYTTNKLVKLKTNKQKEYSNGKQKTTCNNPKRNASNCIVIRPIFLMTKSNKYIFIYSMQITNLLLMYFVVQNLYHTSKYFQVNVTFCFLILNSFFFFFSFNIIIIRIIMVEKSFIFDHCSLIKIENS